MTRRVPSFLASQKEKLRTQRKEKEGARRALNATQYEREKAERESRGSRGYGYSMHQMTGSRARTFREFIEIAEAHTFPLSPEEREIVQRIAKMANSDSKPEKPKKPTPTTRSARKITKFDLSKIVREGEEQINEMPFQIYGPDPHGPSDAEPQPLGKPYKNKKRAKTRANKLDQEIGGYRHFVRKVDDENEIDEKFVPISHDKARRMRNRSFNIGQQSFNTRHTDPEKSKTLQGKKSLIDTIRRDMYSRRLKTDQSTGKPNPEYDDLTYKQQVAHVKGKEKANKQKGKR